MFLKSIEVFGFKSFADKSRIEFSPGISALLGPNGCGKSNVVDAVKWVLGEQASKSLRAERMEDVLFNGTESRKALNVAEVSLTLSNDAGLLALDVAEVEIKRRLFRSGSSEYFINGTPVRLKDLRELFYDTGIGKSAYSIMEQGKIDQVLSTKPEERRTIFEEAAAITKFKAKGQEAERKLERTLENISQVRNILAEVERRYKTLEKQAAKTAQYRDLKDSIFQLEIDQALLRLRKLMEDQTNTAGQLEKATADRDSLKKKIDSINESLEEHMEEVNSMEERLVEAQKNQYRIEVEQKAASSRKAMYAERLEESQAKITAENNRLKGIQQSIVRIEKGIEEKQQQLATFRDDIAKLDTNIEEFGQSIQTTDNRITVNDASIVECSKDVQRLEQEMEGLGEQLAGLTDVIVQELDKGLSDSGYSSARRNELATAINHEIQSLRIAVEGKKNLVGDVGSGKALSPETYDALLSLMEDMDQRLDAIDQLAQDYHASVPAFLDDFLAPEGIITQKREIDESIQKSRDAIRLNREKIEELQKENRDLQQKRDEYRQTLQDVRLQRVQMNGRMDAAGQEIKREKERLEQEQQRQAEIQANVRVEQDRVEGVQKHIDEIESQVSDLTSEYEKAREQLQSLNKEISSRNRSLVKNEQQVKNQMASLGQLQEKVEKIHLKEAEIKSDIRNLYENFRERQSRDLSEFEERTYEISGQYSDVRERYQKARAELRELGQVNLMAPEEFAEVKERYTFLTSQLDDLEKARHDLDRITVEIRKESSQMFLETYEKIKRNFHSLFRRLFGGGRAEIRLIEPDNVLESGIEILAQPPGKHLKNINLLSGGERSMTAVALLFATYMVKPSPFCLLDEIDAALDEENVGRFVSVLTEFSRESQFIVITHNKKTVAGAQALLGVTMEESGVSKVISIRLDTDQKPSKKEEEAVAELS